MTIFATRRFFSFALVAAFLAVALQVGALDQFGRSLTLRTHAAMVGEPERTALRDKAVSHLSIGHAVMYCGAALAMASVVFAIISVQRREPARRSVVFGLLACYLLLQFMLV